MKNRSTRLKKAFWEHGTMRIPSREAALIMDTLRKPKPHTAEREETRARHYRGSGRARPRGRWGRLAAPGLFPRAPKCSSCHKTVVFSAGKVGTKPPGFLGKGFPRAGPSVGEAELCSGQLIQDLGNCWDWDRCELDEHLLVAGGSASPSRSQVTPSHPQELTAESPPHPAIPEAQSLSWKNLTTAQSTARKTRSGFPGNSQEWELPVPHVPRPRQCPDPPSTPITFS